MVTTLGQDCPTVSAPATATRLRPAWDLLLRPSYVVAAVVCVFMAKLLWFDSQIAFQTALTAGTRANLATVLIFAAFLPAIRPARRLRLILVVDIAMSVVLFADLLYFRFFESFLTVPVLLQADQAGTVEGSVIELIRPTDGLFFIDLPALFAAVWLLRRLRKSNAYVAIPPATSRKHQFIVAVSVFLAGAVLAAQQGSMLKSPDVRDFLEKRLWDVSVYSVTGLLGFHAYDIASTLQDSVLGDNPSPAELRAAKARFQRSADDGPIATGGPRFGAHRGSSVLLVQVESLQSFVMNRSIGGQEITPNLNRLAEDSVNFVNAYQQTSGGRTSDAEMLTGCSLYPAASGSAFVRFAGNAYDCLPAVLKGRGYSTSAHHAFTGTYWNRDHMYPSMGYERFYTEKDYRSGPRVGWGLGDREFLTQTVKQLAAKRKPFYDIAVTLTSHHPYDVSNLPTSFDAGQLEGTILGDYVETVHYVDSAIGAMVTELKDAGLWDDTIVVIYGDHDNGVEDWRQYEDLFGEPIDPYDRARIPRSVPMLMHFPNDAHAGTVTRPTGQIDIAPTLSHALGILRQGRYFLGHNAFSSDPRPVLFPDGGFAGQRFLFVPGQAGSSAGGECFEHGTGRVVPLDLCSDGMEHAREDLAVSESVLRYDLIALLQDERQTEGAVDASADPS